MYFDAPIARVETPVGTLDLRGQSPKVTKSILDSFTFRLVAPYRNDPQYYRFRLNLIPDLDVESLDEVKIMNEVIDAFEQLLQLSEVMRRFGRIGYHGSTTRRYVRRQIGLLIFKREVMMEKPVSLAA